MRAAALGGLALAVVACQRSEAPPPAAPRGPTACERAADSMVGAMLARLPASDAPTEQADALRRLIRVRCEQDGWSPEVTRCLIAMRKLDDAAPCATLMPDDQQDALARDLEARSGGHPAGQPAGASDDPADPRSGPSGSSGDTGGSGHPGGGP